MSNFKYLQEVIVLNMLINGTHRDTGGKFIKDVIAGPDIGKLEIEINTVYVRLPEERVVDAKDYWDKKHGRTK